MHYCGGMKQSILLKLCIVLVGTAAISGGVFVGFRHANEVRGESGAVQAPATRATTAVPTLADASEAAHMSTAHPREEDVQDQHHHQPPHPRIREGAAPNTPLNLKSPKASPSPGM